ncbi:DUF2840 domain-containing protein [Erythrobacter aureus]|uniref:DUF2840 domain-containing protein n=1 Tax=Erythrobacter aureus TaxID=2182384 RepID=UPI003A945AE9
MTALTLVEIAFYPEVINDWLRFGTPDAERIIDRRRSLATFAPDKLFAYIRWRGGDYGTADWRLFVLRASHPGEPICTVPGIRPGADMLCQLAGKTKIQRALTLIDDLELGEFPPETISPAWWRVMGNRLHVGLPVRSYGANQHHALHKIRQLQS